MRILPGTTAGRQSYLSVNTCDSCLWREGCIAGRGKGAAIGAAAGAAAGTGAATATGKKDVEIPAETVFQFTLKTPVKVKA